MKKTILFAGMAAMAISFAAKADVKNYVENGDFEAPGFEQSVPGAYTWDPWDKQNYLSVLPGWTLNTGGEWNGGIELKTGEENAGDGDIRPEEDMNYLHFVGYNDNGWAAIRASQVVKGLTAGKEYTLDFVMGVNWPEGASWTPDPDYGVVVAEAAKDAEGADIAGKEIKKLANPEVEQDMAPVSTTFTAPADGQVYLEFYLGNYYGQDNKHDNLWMDLDLVRVWAEGEEGGVSVIASDNVAPVYYNLQGMRVENNGNLKGIYLVKKGNNTVKVVY